MLVSRSTISVTGNYINDELEPVYVPIYPSEGSSSVSAQFAVGAGVTIPISKAYHARIEGRATTFGLQVVTGPTDFQGIVPPTETRVPHAVQHPHRHRPRAREEARTPLLTVRGVILAGGGATRFEGRPKGLEMVGGTPDPRPRRRHAARGPRHSPAHRRQCSRSGRPGARISRWSPTNAPDSGRWAASTPPSCGVRHP